MSGDQPRSGSSDSPTFGDDDLERRVNLLIDRGLESYNTGDLGGALSSWELALTLAPEHARVTEYINYVNANFDTLQARFAQGEQPRKDDPAPPSGLAARPSSVVDLDNDDYDEVEVVIGPAGDADSGPAPASETTSASASEPAPSAAGSDMSSIDDGWGFDEVAALPPPPKSTDDGSFPEEDSAIRQITQGLDLAANAPVADASATEAAEPLEINAPGLEPETPDPSMVETADVESDSRAGKFADGFAVDRKRQRPLSFAARDDVDEEEITVPGGGDEPAPYQGDGASLSLEAIEAIDGGEKTREHPGKIGRGFGLRDIGPLDMSLIGDQLLEQAGRDAEIALQPGTGGDQSGETATRPADDFSADDELTIERGAQKGGVSLGDDEATVDRGPPAGRANVRLDSEADEQTVERRMPGDVGDDELTRERGPSAGSWTGATLNMPSLGAASAGPSSVIVDDSAFADEPPTRRRGLDLDSREGDFASGRGEFDDEEKTVERVRTGDVPSQRTLGPKAVAQLAEGILADLEREPPATESDEDHLRRRVTGLIKRAELESRLGQHATAIVALDLALDESPDSAVAQKVVHRHRDLLFEVFESYLGDMTAIPTLAIPIHELAQQDLDNRVAFLLTRADGSLCFEEILDVSGMPRLETYRHLCKMLLRGILEVR